ncbi:protein trapped in endoderm-1-like [Onthophagus taurus]|uniref:protein trapped in endoderm-1-like n=1 Tax=Onthophagus taurus TaxID=166361 RepID=UPI0039BDBC00
MHPQQNPYQRSATIFAAFCAITFCVFGVLGNSITILALIRCPKLRTHATTFFVLSLCISDLIFCVFNLPLMAIRYIYEDWILGDTLCKIFPVVLYGNVALSLLNMVAITLNRYTIISHSNYYNTIYSKTSIWAQIVFIWTLSSSIMILPLFEVWGKLGFDKRTFSCTILDNNGSPKKMFFLVGIVIPCIIIVISYTCIYLKVRASKKTLEAHQQNHPLDRQTRRQRDDNRLTKLMLLIFICFILCFLPLMCVNVFDDDVKYPFFHILASILVWASSVINPFVYAATNKQYRLAYAKLLKITKSGVNSDTKQCSTSTKNKQNDQKYVLKKK